MPPRILSLLALALAFGAAGCGDDKPGDPSQGAPGGKASTASTSADEALALRERIAALSFEGKFSDALPLADTLAARPDASARDLVNAAILHYEQAKLQGADMKRQADQVRALLDRAAQADPDELAVPYLRGLLAATAEYQPEQAVEPFRRVHEALPDDYAAAAMLADALDQTGEYEQAAAIYEQIRARGRDANPAFYRNATYRLSQLCIRHLGRMQDGLALNDEVKQLTQAKVPDLANDYERGTLARIRWPAHERAPGGAAGTGLPIAFAEAARATLAAHAHLLAADIDSDGRTDLLGWDGARLSLALQTEAGRFASHDVTLDAPLRDVDAADLDHDGVLELVLVLGASPAGGTLARLAFDAASGSFAAQPTPLAADTDVRSACVLDVDHDGDLDVAFASEARGVRVLRHDALDADLWADATPPEAAALGACREVIAEDLDGDSDVDLVVVREHGLALLSSLRGGAFEDVTAQRLPDAAQLGGDVRLADVDGDRLPDLLARSGDDLLVSPSGAERFGAAQRIPGALAGVPAADDGGRSDAWSITDVDSDGHFDVLRLLASGASFVPGPLAGRDTPPAVRALDGAPAGRGLAADVLGLEPEGSSRRACGDGRLELAQVVGDALVVSRPEGAARGISVELEGVADNVPGVGSVVEVRAGELYQRVYFRGERLVVGLGGAPSAGILRVTWPNGVEQHDFDVPAGTSVRMLQIDRHGGSCPFLYTWDGERYVFVSDVLGATPLGLPMDETMLVPFDHEEYVKVRGDQLVPDDGVLRLAVTEELREVTYLDRLRLHAIDHPIGVEIQPDEAFRFPPYPVRHVNTFTRLLAPAHAVANRAGDGAFGWGSSDRVPRTAAVPRLPLLPPPPDAQAYVRDSDGTQPPPAHATSALPGSDAATPDASASKQGMARFPAQDASLLARAYDPSQPLADGGPLVDVAAWVAAEDTRGPRPFVLAPARLRGITRPWSLDLEFGATDEEREAIRDAPRLRLVLTGWIEWGNASVNMAAARDPDWAFVPPVIWVPEGDGWRPSGPPIGFPAGKTKTMVFDVTDLLVRDDPRLRLVTSLELTWDRIALAVDGDDAPFTDTPLEARTAALSFRGFSAMNLTGREDLPELFTWQVRATSPWNQHAGRYTGYGDVLPLLGDVDDRLVILGSGDVVHAEFDATRLPALPDGWTRDWLLYLDGWAKDGDPNTLASQTVEPLPFHGMSRYPPPAGEQPADPAARALWDAEWNTREGRRLIPELSAR
ncbi:MAG: VCBS repeat-containing protein [Planctomycetes bacterium]|nr:VCBS repeat-containing protein [Planctomycetota bacterium]